MVLLSFPIANLMLLPMHIESHDLKTHNLANCDSKYVSHSIGLVIENILSDQKS